MQNSEIIEEDLFSLHFLMTETNEENDDYDKNLDDYDINEEDNYDDGIENSKQDDGFEEDFDEDLDDTDSETAQSVDLDPQLHRTNIEDSLSETEDYDTIDD